MQAVLLQPSDFLRRERCPACAGAAGRVLSRRTGFASHERFPGRRVELSPGVRRARCLCECEGCGLWYYDLVPSPELVKTLLDEPDLHARWGDGAGRPAFRRALEVLGREFARPGAILDVGAHTGGFLDLVPPGWSKAAVEPMDASASRISETRIIPGFLEDVELEAGAYDCISAFDVFEHLRDPDAAVRTIARGLAPGGVAIVETGSADSLGARVLRAGWYYLNFLEHFQVFSRRSLAALFARHGLEAVSARRVRHWHVDPATQLRSLGSVSVFAAVSGLGTSPRSWQAFNRVVRPGNMAMPPSTLGLEPDHVFMVARKPA